MFRSILFAVKGVGDEDRGRLVDDDVIDVAVDHILHRKRAVGERDAGRRKARELPVRVALDVELAGGALLDADLVGGGQAVQDRDEIVRGRGGVKRGVVRAGPGKRYSKDR